MSEVRSPNADTIQQTETQIDNYLVRPEFFKVRKYDDEIHEVFHGQSKNGPEAEQKSREAEFKRGSQRALGNVNHSSSN